MRLRLIGVVDRLLAEEHKIRPKSWSHDPAGGSATVVAPAAIPAVDAEIGVMPPPGRPSSVSSPEAPLAGEHPRAIQEVDPPLGFVELDRQVSGEWWPAEPECRTGSLERIEQA
jgi:hypothetical protein